MTDVRQQYGASSGNSQAAHAPLLAFARDGADIEAIKAFAEARQWKNALVLQGDIITAIDYLKTHDSPEWLLIEIPSIDGASAQLDALAELCDAGTKVSALGAINEYSFYRWLKSIGIGSYALKPLTQPLLEEAWHTALKLPEPASQQEKNSCQVIAVAGARGGVGASTVALNIAGVMAQLGAPQGKQVALVDLDPQRGSLAMMLDSEPSRGLRDALEKPERIDALFVERVMSRPMTNLAVLSAEESLREIVIHNYAAEALLTVLQKDFDIIVLDCANPLSRFSRQCLKYARQVALVAELDLLSLRDTIRLRDFMHEICPAASPVIIANRVGLARDRELPLGDFERGLAAKIACSIPFAPAIFMALEKSIPAVRNPKHKAVAPLYSLARQWLTETEETGQPRKASGLAKLFIPLRR